MFLFLLSILNFQETIQNDLVPSLRLLITIITEISRFSYFSWGTKMFVISEFSYRVFMDVLRGLGAKDGFVNPHTV